MLYECELSTCGAIALTVCRSLGFRQAPVPALWGTGPAFRSVNHQPQTILRYPDFTNFASRKNNNQCIQ
jgi:hypothetical protein